MCSAPLHEPGKLGTLGAKGRACEGYPRKASEPEPVIGIFPVNAVPAYGVQGYVYDRDTTFVIDTGAAVTLLRGDVWDQAKPPGTTLDAWTGQQLVGVEGTRLQVRGSVEVTVRIADRHFKPRIVVVDGLTAEAILGLDFLESYHCTLDIGGKTLHFANLELRVPLRGSESNTRSNTATCARVTIAETRQVPPYSELEVMASVSGEARSATYILEGTRLKTAAMVARALVSPTDGKVPVRLLNPRSEPITVYSGTKVATLEAADEMPLQVAGVTGAREPKVSAEKQAMLWDMVCKSDTELSEAQKQQLFALLLEHADVFASDRNDLGHANAIRHEIDTGTSPPIRQPLRRVPPPGREEMRQLLQDMLQQDVIRPSSSPWASPVVLVKKKDGSKRFCIDYRKVNAVTRKDAYPLPRVDDTLDTLAGSQWLTTIDLLCGYWQVEVSPGDREKTAFCTTDGLFEFTKMPFGLCNAPATFQRLMDLILAGLQWTSCLVYLDDVIIVGKTFEEHLHNLRAVFDRLREAGLKLKPTKCALCRQEVNFLGHIVSADGVATDPAKTEKVETWPIPTSRREVQQFVGLANYYRRFIKNFAEIAKPLHKLTEKTMQFKWTPQCQEAFDQLKRQLTTAPVLAFPDFNRPFTLDTDASDVGIGAVLSQTDDEGKERVVAFASRTLSKAERRYCVTRKELLAVVVFVHHFRPYLLGRKFTLRTDHGSLSWLSNFKQPEGQLARWIEKLQEYNFHIVHRPGRKHNNADALSRLPCRQCGRESHRMDDPVPEHSTIAVVMSGGTLRGHTMESLRQSQLADPLVGFVLQAREKNEKPEARRLQGQSPAARKLIQLWNQLELKDGVLWRRFESEDGSSSHPQLVVPSALREEVLRELHEGVAGGHLGQDKTLHRLKERFYWPGHWTDVANWCRTCATCATRKTPSPKNRAPLQSVQSGYPMQIVAVDLLGPLPVTENGNSYVLVAADYFTRWVEAYPLPNQEAATVAKKLTWEMFFRFSPPEQLHSDQGRQFESELIAELCKLLQIRKSRTTPYHPQGDGLVERFNRTLLSMLATSIKDCQGSWEGHIRAVCMAYNTSVQPTTGFTPFYLMFGRNARIPVDLMYGTNPAVETSPSEYAATLKQTLDTAYSQVREKMGLKLQRQKQFYDRRIHGEPYKEGDLVWLYCPAVPRGQSKKLHHPWSGPFQVLKRLSDSTYRIKNSNARRQRLVVHFDRLKPCAPGTRIELANQPLPPASPTRPTQDPGSSRRMPFGEHLNLVDEDDPGPDTLPRRYPLRNRHPPARLADTIPT